jgi:hypothetical protein
MKTQKATEALMCRTDERMVDRLRSRGWVVERAADPDHAYREYNDAGGTCQAPGCTLAWGDHLPDPCERGCSDPAAHAEGAHDV